MKTAIFLPDELFSEAEQMAAQLQVSRSEFYRRALSEFLARHTPDRVTDALDTVCKGLDMTSNLKWAEAPGNLLLKADNTGLPKDAVVNVSQIVTLDRSTLTEQTGRLSKRHLSLVLSGIDLLLGR